MVSVNSEWVDFPARTQLRDFHKDLPLAGGRPNALLPDDRILSLAAVLRDTPQAAPALSPEAWREFVALLRPHGVYALLAYRLGAWPEDCRPPAEVMDFLKRQQLLAAARSLRAGRRPGNGKTGVRPLGNSTPGFPSSSRQSLPAPRPAIHVRSPFRNGPSIPKQCRFSVNFTNRKAS